MAMTTMSIEVDSELKEKAQDIFSALGLDMSAAISMFLEQSIIEKRPATTKDAVISNKEDTTISEEELEAKWKKFYETHGISYVPHETDYAIKPDPTKTPVFGSMKGKIFISPDFDEPLEEMMEYMY